MKTKDVYLVLRGTLDWAKIVGPARPYTGNPLYDNGPEWTVDITPDANTRKLLSQHGLDKGGKKGTGKLREPGENDTRKETYLSLRVLQKRKDGTENDPPRIVDITGKTWDDKTLIGNGSVADVKVKLVPTGGLYLQAVRVLKHVPFIVDEFAPIKEDDEFFETFEAAPEEGVFETDDLEDEVLT